MNNVFVRDMAKLMLVVGNSMLKFEIRAIVGDGATESDFREIDTE